MIPKYRAWSKAEKIMSDVKRIDFWNSEIDARLFEETAIEEVELMQSTELFDKNGQEIFEGDIVRFFDSLYTVFYDIKEGCYRLKPHEDRWVVDYMCNFSSEESFEVVGNIYENKEYL